MSRIGIITDGQAETYSLPELIPRIGGGNTILRPLFAPIQPLAHHGQIAKSIRSRVQILNAQGVDKIVVALDHETRTECPGVWATTLAGEIARQCDYDQVTVVVKKSTFENWLVADVSALLAMPGRFDTRKCSKLAAGSNRADQIDGLKVIKAAVVGSEYSKVADAVRICRRADPAEIARHSRSFRRFLRAIGDPSYSSQSRVPVSKTHRR